MGSKGSAAKTTTNQEQRYRAHPAIESAGTKALGMAESAAGQPFQMPVAPVAGFNPFQQQSFDQTQAMQGDWQPYVNAARQYYDASAAPITGSDVAQYYNPMAQNVFAQLANQQGQQWRDVTGRLTSAAGGVGAERIAVGQGQLANQQALAYGNVASNLWQQALQAAQVQKQMAAGAAGGMLQTGAAGQTAALRDISTLGQAGLQQQQQQQAELNAPYQRRLAEIAYPFQTAQYLSGITGGVAPALGGKSTGTSTTTSTPAQPSALQQGLGIGMQALGMAMGMPTIPGMGMGSKGSTFGTNMGSGYVAPYGSPGFPMPFAEGGSVISSPALWDTQKGSVPAMKIPQGKYPAPMKFIEHKPTQEPSPNTSPYALASRGLDLISSGMGQRQDTGADYVIDDQADGGAVFPRHFYDGGFVDLSTPTGSPGIPGIDYHLPRENTGNIFIEKPRPAPDMADWGGGAPQETAALPEPGTFAAGAAQSSPPASANLTQVPLPPSGIPEARPALPSPEQLALPAPSEPTPDIPLPVARPEAAGPSGSVIERTANAIRGNEGNVPYNQFHPNPDRRGNYAIGPYGIMDFNVPDWTREALGKSMTIREFMNDPEAQERTAKFKLGQYIKEYGPEGAALKWFTGTATPDPNRNDGYNTASWYLKNFRERFYGDKPPPDVMSSVPRRPEPGYDRSRMELPRARMPYPDALQPRDWGQSMARNPWMSLVKAGTAVATTPGPIGSAIAKGIGAGVDHLTSERGIRQKEETINQRAQQLHQQAQHYLDQYDKMTPYQKESLDQSQQRIDQGRFNVLNYTRKDGTQGVAKFNTKTGETVDAITGQPIEQGAVLSKPSTTGGNAPAMVKTAEWMVKNGIAANPTEAFNKLKTGVKDATSRARLLLDFKKALGQLEPQLIGKPAELDRRANEELRKAMREVESAPEAADAPAGAGTEVGEVKTFNQGRFKKIAPGPDSDPLNWQKVE